MKSPVAASRASLAARSKSFISQLTARRRNGQRRTPKLARAGAVLVFIALAALAFYPVSSASSRKVSRGNLSRQDNKPAANELPATRSPQRSSALSSTAAWLSSGAPTPPAMLESISTFAADCSTPKASFNLGDTACALVTGSILPSNGTVQRRILWVAPDGTTARGPVDVTTDPQSDPFVFPTTGPLAQVGTWTIKTIDNSGVGFAVSVTVARNPATPKAELSIYDFGPDKGVEGNSISFKMEVGNNGPDAAQAVQFTTSVPTNSTFVSESQTSGSAFSCTNPAVGASGVSTCTISSWPDGGKATFTFVYQITPGTPNNTIITNTSSISSTTPELISSNNSFNTEVKVVSSPCVLNCPSDIVMGNDSNQYGALVTYSASANAPCGAVIGTPPSGSFFPVGTTLVTVGSDAGNACSFNVTINDTQTPTISCPSDITTTESAPGSGVATVNYAPPSVTDNDPNVSVSCDHASGSTFNAGTTPVTCTATDRANNTNSCTFNVTVNSTASNCTLSCPADITVDSEANACGAHVTLPDPTTTGDCGTVSMDHASGSLFPVGTTIVHVTSSTGQSCSFRVTVVDAQDPVITCPTDKIVNASASACEAAVSVGTATATDNCPGVTVSGVRDDGDPLNAAYPVGTTIITWTARDASGRTASCQQTVIVRDTVAPVVTLVPTINLTASADTCQVEVPEVLDLLSNPDGRFGTASDNCAGPERLTIVQTPPAGTLVSPGNYTITVTVYDGDPDDTINPPNHTTKTTTLHVTDVTPPVITLNGVNPMTVECHTSFTDPGATANDACAGSFAATASGSVNVNVPGTYTITYNASDPSGNAATPVTRTVNVVDTTRPVITLNGASPMTVECHTSFTDPGATASDSCAGSLAVTTTGSVNINVPGTYTLTYNATDPSGNAAIPVTRTVNVVDTTPPIITVSSALIELWPPNHKYVTYNVTDLVTGVSDSCNTTISINSVVIQKVTSDETNSGSNIIIAPDCKSVQLQRERDGGGDGRVYTITFKVVDASGNVGTATKNVTIPHSQNGNPAVDSGVHSTVNSNCP